MIKNKAFILTLASILLIFLNLLAKEKGRYEKWLDEVNYIITDAEKGEFKKLKKDKEKEFFIKLFWAKRDPTPLTEKNEFKEEFYRRLAYVNKAFIYGYNRGSGTDMGKIWLSFGQPARVFRQDPRAVIWVYPSQPWMNIPQDTFSFVFTAVESKSVNREGEEGRARDTVTSMDRDGYILNVQQTDSRSIRAFYAYPKVIILHPDLKELPAYRKVLSFSPESFEGKLIEQVKSAQEDIVQIPFEKKALFTKASNNSSYLTILVKIDPVEKKDIIEKKLNFFGRVESEYYFYDFSEEKTPLKEKDYFISQVGLPLRPGEYKLFLGFYSPDKKTYSIKADNIEVPDFWTQELAFSSLLASSQVREVTAAAKKDEFDVFSLGRYSLLPFYSQEYTTEEYLNIFYYLYNLAVDENQNCSLTIKLELQVGEKKFKLNPQKRQKKVGEGGSILEGHQIPLSALPESGEYQLIVKVTDEIAKKTISKKLKFILL
jgi:GWxTD domain-containing protein